MVEAAGVHGVHGGHGGVGPDAAVVAVLVVQEGLAVGRVSEMFESRNLVHWEKNALPDHVSELSHRPLFSYDFFGLSGNDETQN